MDDRLRNVEIHLGRVEQRVEDHEGDIHRFAALPTALAEVRWAQDQMLKSLDAVHAAQRELTQAFEEHKQATKLAIQAARDERLVQIEEVNAARVAAEKEQMNLNLELRDRDDQRRSENRRNLYVLAGVFLAAVGQVISGLIGGPTP